MRLMFRSDQTIARGDVQVAGNDILDLSVEANILSPETKLHCLIDICLATYRHERFHGKTFSPFRSTKASLKTYAHAYFMLMVSYVVVLGMLQAQSKGGLTITEIVRVTNEFTDRFTRFFAPIINE